MTPERADPDSTADGAGHAEQAGHAGQAGRVLVLRALGIGDLATSVPALRGLRAALPGAHLALAAPAWLAPLVDLTGAIDRLIPQDGLDDPLPAVFGPAGPDLAVNLHGSGPQSHRLLAAARPRRLLAFANAQAAVTGGPAWHDDEQQDDEHEVRRWCRLLSWYGIACDPGDLALRVPAGEPAVPGAVIVHPGAKSPQRRWPPDRFAAVARRLVSDGYDVVVTGSAAERELAATVVAGAGLPEDRNLAGRLALADTARLVAHARLVICGDTGVAHLATAYGVGSVVLFGPMSPAQWGPPPDRPRHRVLWRPDLPPDEALAGVRVADVLDQVAALGAGLGV